MNNKPTYLSKDGLEKLRAELDEMVTVKRPEVANRIHDAKEHGDLSENAEYEDAKNEQAFVEGRIQTLEALIKNATIIDENHSTDHVQIGSTVARRERRRQGDVHDRRLDRGQARRGPDLEREPGRSRPARQEEGREGRREGPRRRLHLQDRQHQLDAAGRGGDAWTGPTNSRSGSGTRGPQVVNDSKTPSGTVHVGSLRGPVILDAIARALRANGIETTLLYGVDDLDPMDAQALLTPDAVDHEMGRPLAHVPDQAGDCHASYARHHAGIFIDMFAGLGHPPRPLLLDERHLPDRARWIRSSARRSTGPPLVREIYRRVANVQHPDTWHPLGVICPTCGKVGTTIVTDWNGERGLLRMPPGPRDLGDGLRLVGLDLAVRRGREAALEPRVGGPVVAVRRDDRAVRQGPVDRRRLARPVRRDRPRGVRARAAAQRARTSSSTSAARRCRPPRAAAPPRTRSPRSSRPSSSASCSCGPGRTTPSSSIPTAPTQIPRLFDEFDKFAAATAGREVKGELPPGYEATFRYSLLDPDADVAAEAAAFRPAFAHLALLVQIPGVDVAARVDRGEGESADRARDARSSTSASRRPARWLDDLRAGAARLIGPARRAAGRGRGARRRPARVPRRPRRRGRGDAPDERRRLAGAHLRGRRRSASCRPAAPSRRSTSRSSVGPTDRAPAGCWPASIRRSCRRLRAAAAAAGRRRGTGARA